MRPKAGALARGAALLGGLLVMVVGVGVSLGIVLAALLGMAIVGRMQRRRGEPLGRGGYWVAASASMVVVLLFLGGAVLVATPRGTLRSVMQTADSASVAASKEPPPEWLQRLGPAYGTQRQPAVASSPVVTILGGLMGLGFVVGFFSAIYGSLGWGAGMLLGFAVRGRWPGDAASPVHDARSLAATVPDSGVER